MARQKASQDYQNGMMPLSQQNIKQISTLQILQKLFWQPLTEQQLRLWAIFFSLLLLSIAQSSFLLLAGPLLKAFFEFSAESGQIPLSELIPPQVLDYVPALAGLEVAAAILSWLLPALLLSAGIVKGIAAYIYHYQQSAVSLYIAKHYRDQLFSALLRQPYEILAKTSAGRWMSIIMNDVMILQSRFSDLVGGIIKDGVLVLSCIVVLFWVHWPTALILLALSPILAYSLGRSGKRISHFAENWQRRMADMASLILSMRQRFDFIRSQQGEAREAAVFAQHNQGYYEMIRRSLFVRSTLAPGLEFLGFLIFALLIVMIHQGIWFQGDFSGVVLIQFFAALGLVMRPLRNIGEQVARFQETKGSLKQSLETFQTLQSSDTSEQEQRQVAPPLPEEISLNNLRLGYNGELFFQADKLKLRRSQCIAIIGPSGSGKSTLLKALAGLIEPISCQSQPAWQQIVARSAYVSQKTFLFDASVMENLSYGLQQQPERSEVEAVLQAVRLLDTIQAIPTGLDTEVQSVQHNFSGGQLQRLMVARALLRKSDLLLLDESTSAVDSKTEEDMIRLLLEQCRASGQILLFVTHRMRWLEAFDQVWFIENGEIKMAGPHQELISDDRYQNFLMES